jgi:ATP-dependent helicase/nuclease subunit A
LEYVANLRAGAAREGEARASAEGAVQLMSVHAAKGLQFPIVVIGDAGYQRNSRPELLFDPEMGLLLPLRDEDGRLPGMYCLRQGLAADQEAAETDRLLYVAATRAQEKVVLSGLIGLSSDGRPARLAGWLSQLGTTLALPDQRISYQEGGGRALPLALKLGETPVGGAIYEPRHPPARRRPAAAPAAPEPAGWQPALLQPVPAAGQHLDAQASEREREPPQGLWWVLPPAEGWQAPTYLGGRLVHEALARWRFEGPELGAWLEARARNLGLVEPPDLEAAGRLAAAMLARFRRHAAWAEADGAAQRYHEVPYTLLDAGGRVESGIIDLLYFRDGRWTLVDFKTDRLAGRADVYPHAARQGYWQQLARYAAAAERLLGERPRAVLCLLDVGGDVVVCEPEGSAA